MTSNVDAKLLKSTKFPPEFSQRVDITKVNVEVIKKWIAGKISDILGSEDDVVIELCFGLLETGRYPDVKKLQIQLTGFLDKDTPAFCKELWTLCLSAQSNPQGVPKELLEAKKLELIQEKIQAEKAAEEARKRRDDDHRRERDLNNTRDKERGDRGRRGGRGGGRGGDSWAGAQGDRDFGRGSGRFNERRRPSISPPRRRGSRDRGSFRGLTSDRYVPTGRGHIRRDGRRRSTSGSRSPSSARSDSKSRSPSRRRRRSSSRSHSSSLRRRSRSAERRVYPRGRSMRRSSNRDTHRRSSFSSDSSRSPPTRPTKRRRSPSTSRSASPYRRRRRDRSSGSGSRSPLVDSRRRSYTVRDRTGPSMRDSDKETSRTKIGAQFGRERDERRLTRSRSRSITPPRRRRRSSTRSHSRDGRDRKRRRSIQRYEPASKRRRSVSSVSAKKSSETEDNSDRVPGRRAEGGRETSKPTASTEVGADI